MVLRLFVMVPQAELLSSSVVDLVRIGLNADPDPASGSRSRSGSREPSSCGSGPWSSGQTLKLQKIRVLHER